MSGTENRLQGIFVLAHGLRGSAPITRAAGRPPVPADHAIGRHAGRRLFLQGAVDFAYFQPCLCISRGTEAAINHGCQCSTGTALNAVSARNGSSQNMVAAIANIVTRLVTAPARPFCRKRARESTSTVMRVRRESACFSCQGVQDAAYG